VPTTALQGAADWQFSGSKQGQPSSSGNRMQILDLTLVTLNTRGLLVDGMIGVTTAYASHRLDARHYRFSFAGVCDTHVKPESGDDSAPRGWSLASRDSEGARWLRLDNGHRHALIVLPRPGAAMTLEAVSVIANGFDPNLWVAVPRDKPWEIDPNLGDPASPTGLPVQLTAPVLILALGAQ
jgi:hypothetical protein